MKKTIIVLLVFFASSLSMFGQKLDLNTTLVHFYGIDFSEVRVAGASEDDDLFVGAFMGINGLLVSEPAKYDFSQSVKCPVETDITMITEKTRKMDRSEMREREISDVKAEDLVSAYSLPHKEGTGMILIARMLDKKAAKGTFDIVFFDIATRNIVYTKRVTKKAGGFGLRNFWAHPVYEMIKDKKLFS